MGATGIDASTSAQGAGKTNGGTGGRAADGGGDTSPENAPGGGSQTGAGAAGIGSGVDGVWAA